MGCVCVTNQSKDRYRSSFDHPISSGFRDMSPIGRSPAKRMNTNDTAASHSHSRFSNIFDATMNAPYCQELNDENQSEKEQDDGYKIQNNTYEKYTENQ